MARRFLVGVPPGGRACYHVVSRVVDRRLVFGAAEKAWFRRRLGALSGFCGVDVLTFCLMGNHFHLLVSVPEAGAARAAVGDAEFFRRLGCLYPPAEVGRVRRLLAEAGRGSPARARALRARYLARMFSLPEFVRELKRGFSAWYNRRAGRTGTLWEGRYRSVAVGGGRALAAVAAYIDLNPARAGLEGEGEGPYRWSGYGEAVRGGGGAREGLARALDPEGGAGRGWAEVAEAYAGMLALQRPPPGAAAGAGRLRALSRGLAVGGRGFLERVFAGRRGWFGPRRATGARPLRGPGGARLAGPWEGLAALRDLR